MLERREVEIPRHIFDRLIPIINTSVAGVIEGESAFVGTWQRLAMDYPPFEAYINKLGAVFIKAQESLDESEHLRRDSRWRRADVLRMADYFPKRVFEHSEKERIRNLLALVLIARLHAQDVPINAPHEKISAEARAILAELTSDRVIGSHTTNMTDIVRNILEGNLELPSLE